MLNVTDLRSGVVFKEDNNFYQVLSYEHIKMGRGSGNIKIKVRNLKNGTTFEKSFITGARVNEALVEKRPSKYLYSDENQYYFMNSENSEQFELSKTVLGESGKFLKEGMEVNVVFVESTPLGIELPNGLVFSVVDTGPQERGNTVSNVFKDATLDNGLVIKVPMYMKVGERIKVDTRTCEYIERVK